MVLACEFSVKKGRLQVSEAERVSGLLEKYGLPVRLPGKGTEILAAIRMDKKRQGDSIRFVLLSEIGRAFVEEVPIGELEAFLVY